MSKHKTRQEKIIADLHRKLQSQSSLSASEKQTTTQQQIRFSYSHAMSPSSSMHTKPLILNVSYVKHDLYKTLVVTTVIIAVQLLLLYTLKTHLIVLPIVHY